MNRFWAAVVMLTLVSLRLLYPVSSVVAADPTTEPTPTVQPTSEPFVVAVVVETQGIDIPDDLILQTDFGNHTAYRHIDRGRNHYQDFVQVRLDSAEMWIFAHEGNLGVGGTRNDESWELFPVIVPTPFTMTVSVHNPGLSCQDGTIRCNNVTATGDPLVFTLEHNRNYDIELRVDYNRGAASDAGYLAVTSTIR